MPCGSGLRHSHPDHPTCTAAAAAAGRVASAPTAQAMAPISRVLRMVPFLLEYDLDTDASGNGRGRRGVTEKSRRLAFRPTMPAKRSAGILLHRLRDGAREVLLVHPGGPFWAKKDLGAWSIPKGEYEDGEDPRACALREFQEELGAPPPDGELVDLGEVHQRGGKVVTAWALEGDADPDAIRANTFTIEWPPRSGKQREFPEVDRAGWFGLDEARERILAAQAPLLDRLAERTT